MASQNAQGETGPFQAFIPGVSQTVTVSGTSASTSTAFTKTLVRLYSTEDCYIKVGFGAQTATSAHMFLPADTIEYIGVAPGFVIAAIQVTTGGTLYVTEGA